MQTCLAMQFIVCFWRKYIDSCISTASCMLPRRRCSRSSLHVRTDHLTFNLNFFLDTTPLPQAAKRASQPLLHHRKHQLGYIAMLTPNARGLKALQAVRPSEHGRHIFVYTNIDTKQVIYSLRRTLKVGLSHHPIPHYLAPSPSSSHAIPAQFFLDPLLRHSRTPTSTNSPSSANTPCPPPSGPTSGSRSAL
jgi:hypothetical protein